MRRPKERTLLRHLTACFSGPPVTLKDESHDGTVLNHMLFPLVKEVSDVNRSCSLPGVWFHSQCVCSSSWRGCTSRSKRNNSPRERTSPKEVNSTTNRMQPSNKEKSQAILNHEINIEFVFSVLTNVSSKGLLDNLTLAAA